MLDEGEFGVLNFYSDDQLTAMKLLRFVWEEVPYILIQKCRVLCVLLFMSGGTEVLEAVICTVRGEES